MFNALKMSLKIDMTYAINSFIYTLKKLPIFKDLLIDNSLYKSKKAKSIIRIFGIVFSSLRIIVVKLLYIMIIYYISKYISPKHYINTFIHIYFMFTMIGFYINNKTLSTSTKKYFSIILFNMDAKKYLKSDLFLDFITNFILNFTIISGIINVKAGLILAVFTSLGRIIGEAISIWYYKKYNYLLITNLSFYWSYLITFILLSLLPFINVYISINIILIITLVLIPIASLSYYYINKVKDYKYIYKQLNTINKVMSPETQQDYNRQHVVELRDKDKMINNKKIKNKKGYDLFNTIFFERHKQILLRSSRMYSIVLGIIFIIGMFLVSNYSDVSKIINSYILNKLGWLVIIMYFINRGSIVTQAMFYNCDHSMLTFNFYREPKVILNLFRKRLVTITKINIIPALVISVGIVGLLHLSGGTTNIINYITIPVFVISLSVFFSVHYLVIYYLLQPYNKQMKIKSLTYTVILLLTYIISYGLTKLVVSSLIFSILGVLFTSIYIILSIFAVYKLAPLTFRIR